MFFVIFFLCRDLLLPSESWKLWREAVAVVDKIENVAFWDRMHLSEWIIYFTHKFIYSCFYCGEAKARWKCSWIHWRLFLSFSAATYVQIFHCSSLGLKRVLRYCCSCHQPQQHEGMRLPLKCFGNHRYPVALLQVEAEVVSKQFIIRQFRISRSYIKKQINKSLLMWGSAL